MKNFYRKIILSGLALLVFSTMANAQSAIDGFNPNADGLISVVVVQPDGKILLGGNFTALSPNGGGTVTRNRIARINPDGTLDTAFDPNATGQINAIAVQADGKILVGGFFNGANSIGGQPRNYIARLDAITGLADSFNPNANNTVNAIALQADGKIWVGGSFNGANSIGGQTRNRIARLDPTTGSADSLDPNANSIVSAITVQPDGKVLAGGSFTSMGGQTRNRIARLNTTTGLADSFDPNANNTVSAIAVQADGKVLAGGIFSGASSIGGQTRNFIARLDATTGAADSFNPNANTSVQSIAVQADGRILAGGAFTNIGGATRNRIARLNPTTGLADLFDPNVDAGVRSIAVQADGKILAGGSFTTLAPNGGTTVVLNRIARLQSNGLLDRTLNLSTVGDSVQVTAVQPDGRILIGGRFTTVLGMTRNNIARLNTDGTLDTSFNPNANSDVYAIALEPGGKILAGGVFTSIGGQTRNYIARVDATTGAADMAFDPNANNTVFAIAVQADGKILAGGSFTNMGGQTRNRIARLDATTGTADSFDPNANNFVFAIAVQADGKILAGGQFLGVNSIGGATRNRIARLDATTGTADSFDPNANNLVFAIAVQVDGKILAGGPFNGANSIGGATRNYIVRLDATTGLADSFNPNANGTVRSIAVQADGKILAGGEFTNIGGATRNHIARLDATSGAADMAFDPNANTFVLSIALQADGKILVGGLFDSVGGQSRNLFARLRNDTAALQNLAVTQNTITWTRGGSSPQFARVLFETSSDNLNYAPVGSGTPAGSNWILTGLNLPAGQNFYIRARGYYRSGYRNGSESITESVRNAFISRLTRTPFDFDGDGKTDLSIFRPGPAEWYYQQSSTGITRGFQFGNSTDRVTPGDFTGDGKTDIAFWRPSTGQWYVLRSEDSTFYAFPFGSTGDIAAPADFDGDGRADAAVYRPSLSTWFILRSTGGVSSVQFGIPTDQPQPSDYDGDGKADVAIFRPGPGEWWILKSGNGQVLAAQFGTSTDKATPGDFTGDGKSDIAFFRPSNGTWYVLRSENSTFYAFPFGANGDKPVPGDYDGDGMIDAAVFRPADTNWYVLRSTGGVLIQQYGLSGDAPLPNVFVR